MDGSISLHFPIIPLDRVRVMELLIDRYHRSWYGKHLLQQPLTVREAPHAPPAIMKSGLRFMIGIQ